MANAIDLVTLADILDNTTTGFISLIDTSTKLKDLNTTFTNFDLMSKTLVSLETAKVFGNSSPFKDTIYDKNSTVIVSGTNNAYQQYVADNGSEPPATLSDFVNALTTTQEGADFLNKFLNGTLTDI